MALPPGFRFHPTDEELVAYYLKKKVKGCSIEFDVVADVDLYKCEPWDLPSKSLLPGSDLEWFFFSPRDRKYPNGSRTNRATEAGYWKATGRDRTIKTSTGASKIIGMKKTLVFYTGRAPHGGRTDWLMHEYRLDGEEWDATSVSQDGYVLCRVFKKTAFVAKDPGGRPADEEVEIDGDPIVFDVDVKPSLELPAPTTPPLSSVDHAQDAAPLEQQQEIQNFPAEEGDLLCDVLQNYDETSFPKPDGNFWDCLLDDQYPAGPVVPDFGPSTCGTGIAQETIAQETMKAWQPEHVPRLDVAALGLDSLWNDVDPAELSLLPSFNTLPVGADVFDEELDIMPPLVPSPSISDDSDLIDPGNLTLRQRPPWEPPARAFPSNMTASHRVLFQPRRVDRGRDKGGTTEVKKPPVAAHDPEVKNENNTVSEGTAAAKAPDGEKSGDAVDSPTTIMPAQTESPVNAARLDERSPALPHPTNELPCSVLDNKVFSNTNSASIRKTPSSSRIVSDTTLESDLGPEAGSELTKAVNQMIESPHDPSHLPPRLPTPKPTPIMTKPSAVDPANQGPIRSVLLSVSDPLFNVKPSNREYKSGLDTIHVRTVTITCHEGDPPQMRATVCDSYRHPTYGHVPAERKIRDAKESEKRDSRILGWAFLVGTISASLAMLLCIEIGRGPAESFQPKRVLGHAGCK